MSAVSSGKLTNHAGAGATVRAGACGSAYGCAIGWYTIAGAGTGTGTTSAVLVGVPAQADNAKIATRVDTSFMSVPQVKDMLSVAERSKFVNHYPIGSSQLANDALIIVNVLVLETGFGKPTASGSIVPKLTREVRMWSKLVNICLHPNRNVTQGVHVFAI
jgi:hypothetical protein